MAKKIDWLDNFAESMAKKTNMSKVASKITKEDIIVDREEVKNAKIGETINFNGKLYKVADLNFEDEKGPGAVLTEVDEAPVEEVTPAATPGSIDTTDPMSVSMGAPATGYETGQKPQEYARTNPGDIYHYEVPETFEQAAVETAQQIETERNFDRSSVPGHYTAPKNMGGAPSMEAPIMEAPIMETPVTEVPMETPMDAPVEEVVEETPVDEVLEAPTETPVDETLVEETPAEEVVEDEVVEDEDKSEDEDEDKDKEPVIGTRYNRILRRIMASK